MKIITLWVCDEDGENRDFIVEDCRQFASGNYNRMLQCKIVAETHAQEEDVYNV